MRSAKLVSPSRGGISAEQPSGLLRPDRVIGERVAFTDAALADERMAKQLILKAVIDPRL